jgi:hypothetical protein
MCEAEALVQLAGHAKGVLQSTGSWGIAAHFIFAAHRQAEDNRKG